jgi:hypothetical protein
MLLRRYYDELCRGNLVVVPIFCFVLLDGVWCVTLFICVCV